MLISMLISIFGLLIWLRTAEFLSHQRFISHKMQKILTLSHVWGQFFLYYMFQNRPILHWSSVFLLSTSPLFVISIVSEMKFNRFEGCIVETYDQLIMLMCGGKSLKQSLLQTSQTGSVFSREILKDMYDALSNNQTRLLFDRRDSTKHMFLVLKEANEQQFKTIERLRSARKFIKTCERIKTKCKRGLAQTKAQSFVVSTIYIVALIWTLKTHINLNEILPWVLTSSLLMIAGHLWLVLLGRKIQWKV